MPFGAVDASIRLIAAGPIGAVRIDIHLVLEDAVRAATGAAAAWSFALPAHRRHLPPVDGPLATGACRAWAMTIAEASPAAVPPPVSASAPMMTSASRSRIGLGSGEGIWSFLQARPEGGIKYRVAGQQHTVAFVRVPFEPVR